MKIKEILEQQVLKLPRNLTHDEAYRLAVKKSKHDFRGFVYDPETGKCVLT